MVFQPINGNSNRGIAIEQLIHRKCMKLMGKTPKNELTKQQRKPKTKNHDLEQKIDDKNSTKFNTTIYAFKNEESNGKITQKVAKIPENA